MQYANLHYWKELPNPSPTDHPDPMNTRDKYFKKVCRYLQKQGLAGVVEKYTAFYHGSGASVHMEMMNTSPGGCAYGIELKLISEHDFRLGLTEKFRSLKKRGDIVDLL